MGKALWETLVKAIDTGVTQEVVRVLEQDPEIVFATDEEGRTALHYSGEYLKAEDRPAVAKPLIRAGSHLEARDKWGQTPLHKAATAGFVEVSRALLEAGADVNARDNWLNTPLMVANYQEPLVPEHSPVLELLLSFGADVHARDDRLRTALHFACGWGDEKCIRLLLRAGSDANAADERGRTPLHEALVDGGITAARELREFGCFDLSLKDREGKTVLDIAREKGRAELVAFLEDWEASGR